MEMSFQVKCGLDGVDCIEFLPGEEFHLFNNGTLIVAGFEGLCNLHRFAAHMTVCSGLQINWLAETKTAFYCLRSHVEKALHHLGDLRIGLVHLRCAVGIDTEADRFCLADGVCHLHEYLVGHAGGHKIFGDMAAGVCCTAVYLARVLAGEGTTAMGAAAAIGVDDYLAAGQAGVGVWTAKYKLAGGVDVEYDVFVEECAGLLGEFCKHTGDQHFLHVFPDAGEHPVFGLLLSLPGVVGWLDEFVVLGGDDKGVDAERLVVVVIFHSDLALGVRAEISDFLALAEICHLLSLAADVGEFADERMGEVKGEGHVVFGLADSIAEHHALVACALVIFLFAVYALGDVGALLMDGVEDAAAVAVEAVSAAVVAYLVDERAHHVVDVDVGFGSHLTGHYDLAGGAKGFDAGVAFGVTGKKFIEQSVRDLVCDFIRVSFRH